MNRYARRIALAPAAALLALNLADGLSTLAGLARGASEAQAPAAAALSGAGGLGIIGLGLAGLAAELVVLALMPRRARPLGWALVLVLSAFPVIHNAVILAAA